MIAVSNIPSSHTLYLFKLSYASLVHGSHTEQAYSSDGRTRDLYACSLTVVELMLMFLQRKPSVLFGFDIMLCIWLSHLRSDCIVTPRYLALSACSSWCPCRVYSYFIGVSFRVMDSTVHLSGWKAIFHFFFECVPTLIGSILVLPSLY